VKQITSERDGVSQEAVGVDVDLDADIGRELHLGEPLAQRRLDVDMALGLQQKAAAMAVASKF
jgi:hypothetical protein